MMLNNLARSITLAFVVVVGIGLILYQSNTPSKPTDQPDLVSLLQEYIRIDTTHPHPQYEKAITFLQHLAVRDGLIFNTFSLPSGRPVGVITYQGSNPALAAVALNHHMDVVPAPNKQDWITDPFAGEIVDGMIIGRGVQDMKGIGLMHYVALRELKQSGFAPERTVHIFAVPDEEIGGFTGTKEFVATHFFKQLNVGFVVDEGHASGTPEVLDLKISERKPMQIEVTAKGALAHGSHLLCHNAIHELLSFLDIIRLMHEQEQRKAVSQQPGALLSMNITSLTAGVVKGNGHKTLNIVPDCAQATIDIRVPPTMKHRHVTTMLESKMNDFKNLSYKVLAQAQEEPELGDYKTELYRALETTITSFGLQARPHFFEGATDLRFYLDQGIQGIGLTPFIVEDNIHGTNESVPVEQLIFGKELFKEFVRNFCG